MECIFYFEVLAPNGLNDIEQPLLDSGLLLTIYHSHFNHKNILTSKNELIELGMQTSTTDVMYGSGFLYCEFEHAVAMMKTLSEVFKKGGYPHKIGVDAENNGDNIWINHNYS